MLHATQLEVQTRDAAEAVKANAALRAELAQMQSDLSKQQATVEADLRARDQRIEELKQVKAELVKRNKQMEKLQQQIGDGAGRFLCQSPGLPGWMKCVCVCVCEREREREIFDSNTDSHQRDIIHILCRGAFRGHQTGASASAGAAKAAPMAASEIDRELQVFKNLVICSVCKERRKV